MGIHCMNSKAKRQISAVGPESVIILGALLLHMHE